ncbi:MAG: chromate transporter [Candidatus Rokubacteria bacterium]|nr:chromate transporter [Candidatus Rokubacteria bacterium]
MTDRARPSLGALTRLFAWIGLTSVGGGRSAYFYDALVVQRRWLRGDDFVQDLTMSQLLPGPSTANLSVAVGVRLGGPLGAACAVFSMVLPGAIILFLLTLAYFGGTIGADARPVLRGMSAGVVGLMFVTAWRMTRSSIRDARSAIIALGMFLAVGPLHVSTPAAIVVGGALSIWLHRPRG